MNSTAVYEDLEEDRRRDFEQQVVYKILRSGGAIDLIRQFKEEQCKLSGSPRLTLQWLRARYPAFPLQLGACVLAEGAPEWIDLFQRFTRISFFKAYREWCRSENLDDREDTVGLVFNMDGVTFVLHNRKAALRSRAWRATRIVGDPPVTFAIEGLRSLLESIGKDWATVTNSAREGGG